MTLDEAIKHAEEVAEEQESNAHTHKDMMVFKQNIKHNIEAKLHEKSMNECMECTKEYRQLAEWLRELKCLRDQKPCEDCISRQTAKLKVARVIWEDGDSYNDFHDKCVDCLNEVPPVTPQQKIGRWMECGGDEPWLKGYCCSLCNFTTTQKYDYCTCGAKMVEPQESEG